MCQCKPGAGCYSCKQDKINTSEWYGLVRNRQLDELEDILASAKHAYYCTSDPELSDTKYDFYEGIIRQERPDSWILTQVGCPFCFKEPV